eukprot:scaffold765_cov345-Prasinococcus_capsulatus_cf.AAC.4
MQRSSFPWWSWARNALAALPVAPSCLQIGVARVPCEPENNQSDSHLCQRACEKARLPAYSVLQQTRDSREITVRGGRHGSRKVRRAWRNTLWCSSHGGDMVEAMPARGMIICQQKRLCVRCKDNLLARIIERPQRKSATGLA